ncbi:ribonuclease H1 [Chanos chanos]|uniref:Ribonuclease H1 n=1 Tax=Chanos chanos TaxID=29144 RepID=A0A6J2V2C9_CHACN|nr:ribonuclease H1 [Chanos chanos]
MFRLPGLFSVVRRALCSSADEMGKKGRFFYAVRKGLKPGVYNSWDECKSQVDKFPCAVYKKFASEEDAWSFVRSQAAVLPSTPAEGKEGLTRRNSVPIGVKRRHETEEYDATTVKRVKSQKSDSGASNSDGFTYMGDAVVVYTDGCCTGNGRDGARAGIGVYWGQDHPLNVAERLQGRQTNQRAELQAACKALEQAREMNIKKLALYTDSMFTINGITKWVKTWKTSGWRLKSGGQVTNKEDFQKLDKLNEEVEVVWLHIPGHSGYRGNEEADRLSREGAAKPLH